VTFASIALEAVKTIYRKAVRRKIRIAIIDEDITRRSHLVRILALVSPLRGSALRQM
jgi:hypothetical protein